MRFEDPVEPPLLSVARALRLEEGWAHFFQIGFTIFLLALTVGSLFLILLSRGKPVELKMANIKWNAGVHGLSATLFFLLAIFTEMVSFYPSSPMIRSKEPVLSLIGLYALCYLAVRFVLFCVDLIAASKRAP